jgi:hypothetical protein
VSIWRIVSNKYGMLVLGVIALAVGIFMLNRTEVTCGSEVMQVGDVCEHTKRGVTTSTNSFEEEQANQRLGGTVFTAAGSALALGGAGWIVVSRLRGRRAETAQTSPVAAG